MRLAALSTLFIISIAAWGPAAYAGDFKHDWRQEESEDAFKFISNHPAPASYSDTGEPEATMTMEADKAPEGKNLEQIVKEEIANIRDGFTFADYPEEGGHKPDKGIVSYIEEIDGQKVAFIKYRVAGNANVTLAHPRSVTHAILLKGGQIWYVHLIVLYPGHLDEVRADQMLLVKTIINR